MRAPDASAATAVRSSERGFTLVELLAYLMIFTAVTGTLMGSEVAARRLNRNEAATLEALGQADRAFSLFSEDCDRAVGITISTVKSHQEVAFLGGEGVKWVAKAGELLRGRSLVCSFVDEVQVTQPDAVKHPRLVHVKLVFRRKLVGKDTFEKSYERSFLIRNLDGDGRGGL